MKNSSDMNSENKREHIPVMQKEVLEFLNPSASKRYVDGTLGLGGHSKLILDASAPDGELIGIDRDSSAILKASCFLSEYENRFSSFKGTYDELDLALDSKGWDTVDGVLLDCGVSSMQLDSPDRGFSFRNDGPLDMRMDPDGAISAADILRTASEEELARIFYEYGEERKSRRLAKRIVEIRKSEPFLTTKSLADICCKVCGTAGTWRIHPATRAFQGLRIAVNDELSCLESVMENGWKVLAPDGVFVVISFHSLEDRIVKWAFRGWKKAGYGKILTRKPIQGVDNEISGNPRARSAKLRAFKRT